MRTTTSTALALVFGLGIGTSALPAAAQQAQQPVQPQAGEQQIEAEQPTAAEAQPLQHPTLQEIERALQEARQALEEQDRLRAEQAIQAAQQALYQADREMVAAPATGEPAVAEGEPAVGVEQPVGTAEPTVARPGEPASPLYSLRADELVGRDIVNDMGETIGSIDDLVVNLQDESVYALVSVGGFLGIGAREVALPLDDLQLTPDDELLLPGMTRERLEQMAEHERGTYPLLERERPIMERRATGTAG